MPGEKTFRLLAKRVKALGKAASKKGLLLQETRAGEWTGYTLTCSDVYSITFRRIWDAETFVRALKTKGGK